MAFEDLSPYEETMNCKKREEQQNNISRHSVKSSRNEALTFQRMLVHMPFLPYFFFKCEENFRKWPYPMSTHERFVFQE